MAIDPTSEPPIRPCRFCETPNPSGAYFCSRCGMGLAAATGAPIERAKLERKTALVVTCPYCSEQGLLRMAGATNWACGRCWRVSELPAEPAPVMREAVTRGGGHST